MFKQLKATYAMLLALFGVKEIPIVDGKLGLTDEQESKLEDKFGEEFVSQMKEAFETEISSMSNEKEFDKVKQEVSAMLTASGYTEEEQETILGSDTSSENLNVATEYKSLMEKFLELKAQNNEFQKKIDLLIKDPEPESTAENIIQKVMQTGKIKHSATHLFGSGKQYDSFENRPWNVRLRDGLMKATDFNQDSNIPTLQDDVEHFVRENPKVIDSLFDDFDELPKEWSRRTGVLDRIASGAIIPGEIVQGRKKGWAPKNNFKFDAEEGKVYRKKIDISFDGYELQEIENTWVGTIHQMDGSQPWKMSFIGFLLSELVKQQKLDDRIAQINGIYARTPDGEGIPGAAINSQSGLRWLWWYYRDSAQKIRPFNLGAPTEANIVDYIKNMIELIPSTQRNQTGWEIQISEEWYKKYCEKAGLLYSLDFKSDLGKSNYPLDYPVNYPNFKFQPLKDKTNTDFIGIVKSSNVEILDYNTNEKGKFTVTHNKRNTDIFADYRLGIRFIYVGMKASENDPDMFNKQMLFCNNVPIFDEKAEVPVFDDQSGILKLNFNQAVIGDGWNTDIESIEGLKDGPYVVDLKGKIVTITGNPNLTGTPAVKKNTDLQLASDFSLKTAGTLTLLNIGDGKYKEIKRTASAPVVDPSELIVGTVIDAAVANDWRFEASDSATLSDILNGVHGQTITITKTNAETSGFTVDNIPDKVSVASTAVLDTKDDTISLINVNGVWYEVSRSIA